MTPLKFSTMKLSSSGVSAAHSVFSSSQRLALAIIILAVAVSTICTSEAFLHSASSSNNIKSRGRCSNFQTVPSIRQLQTATFAFLPATRKTTRRLFSARADTDRTKALDDNSNGNNDDEIDDDALLVTVTTVQLVALCQQFNLPSKGTKQVLLERLRTYAAEQAELEKQRLLSRVSRVQEGDTIDSKEQYEIVSDEYNEDYDEDDDEENMAFFY